MKTMINRRDLLKQGAGAAMLAGTGLSFPGILRAADTVKVGLSIPVTGLQAILGETLMNCYKLAADELNAANGIAGRKVELIVEDNQTTTKGAVDKARKLIGQDKVDVVMGTIISLERSATLSVTSRAKKLFFYPTNFEGGECDRYFVATGPIPMQQVDPMAPWIVESLGKTVYIMGSDYAWPRKMTEAITAALEKAGGKVVGADFYPFGTQDFGPAFQKIKDSKPDIVWSMVVGNDAVTQLKQYRSFDMRQPLIAPLDEVFNKDACHPALPPAPMRHSPTGCRSTAPPTRLSSMAFASASARTRWSTASARPAITACISMRSPPKRPAASRTPRFWPPCPRSNSTRRRARCASMAPTIIVSSIPSSAKPRTTASVTRW